MNVQIKNKHIFIEELKDLYRLHIVTKDFKHIIEYEPGSWKMFEPSKFVYSYFAFNSFYNFDWQKSCETLILTPLEKIVKHGKEEYPNEENKFKAMIDFIFNHSSEEDRIEFTRFIKRPKGNNPISNKHLFEYIEGITSDKRITESEREDFKKEFKKMIESDTLKIGKLKLILRFIYLVRNNIFHGTKNTIEMSDKNQRKRLEIYSNILIATNELLFKSLQNILQTKFDGYYNLKLDDRN